MNVVDGPSRQQLLLDLLGEVQYDASVGFKWVPNEWKLEHIQPNAETSSEEPSQNICSIRNKKETQRFRMNVRGRFMQTINQSIKNSKYDISRKK